MRCGSCGVEGENGDVCCLEQAKNQGRIHATCNHPGPAGMSPELEAAYEEGVGEGIDRWNRVIAYPGDRPPLVTSAPADVRGLTWSYTPATCEEAKKALEVHQRDWSDWGVDEDLQVLAAAY